MPFAFEHTYARLADHFFAQVDPTPVARPSLLALNTELAAQLGLADEDLTSPAGLAVLAGNRLPPGAKPIALAYAGHQFGNFVPQLGDGRAILLGELVDREGHRYDVQLKGAGPTPFSRSGDGRAAIGPVLREYVLSEAMAALGVPTTRALAAVATGESVYRESALPGAVLTRVAASHLRIGTFQYFAARRDHAALTQLTDYALARHYPQVETPDGPALALFDAVMTAQAKLVARWLALGFVHGVMNTDNTSISGETLDYGPCAFLDGFDPQRAFSSIDRHGRYAFAQQPSIARWNLARLAETLIPLVHEDPEQAIPQLDARLATFSARFDLEYSAQLRRKLGFVHEDASELAGELQLAQALLTHMAEGHVDYTLAFRRLTEVAAGAEPERFTSSFEDPDRALAWVEKWRERLAHAAPSESTPSSAEIMRLANPAFIPRNHRIEEMITAATAGDLGPFERLNRVLARPYDDQPEAVDLAEPPGESQWSYRTFCGT